jgi:hypothetical protein
MKIKVEFSVKGKIFSGDYYFTSHQTPKNTKNIFRKSFYGETNGALKWKNILDILEVISNRSIRCKKRY